MSQLAPISRTDDWRATHAPHLPPGSTFTRERFPHPDGTWVTLECPCGQKHLTIDPDAEPTVQ